MLLLASLFGTTIDELVRGDVDEMREMVERNEQGTKALAVALGAVEVVVIAVLAVTAVVGREYLEPVLRLLLAALVLVVGLIMRRQEDGRNAKSVAELLGAATGEPAEAARETTVACAMRLVLQVLVGLGVGVGVMVLGGLLLDMREFVGLAVAVGAVAAMAVALMLGRYARPAWTAVILPALWVVGAVAVSIKTGGFASPRGWLAVAGGAISLLAFLAIGRRRRG